MPLPLDPQYVAAFTIECVLLDKDTGAPLSGGQVFFYRDNNRGVLKPVWQITGTSPNYTFTQLPNPMILSSIGTFVDANDNPVVPYFKPWDADDNIDLYYVKVLSSGDVEQFTREAVPDVQEEEESGASASFENEISNPQFAEVLFDTTTANYAYNVTTVSSLVLPLGPDWDLVVSAPGVGSVTVEQITPQGSLNIQGNPGTILQINSAGLSRLLLRQRIYGSPSLWSGGFVSTSFTAKTESGTTPLLKMYYSQSAGTVVNIELNPDNNVLGPDYEVYESTVEIPESDSTQTFPGAYIDIFFDIPLSTIVDLTNIMLAFTGTISITDLAYNQDTMNRHIDHLFHYYQPLINFKPIPSLLTGWDFPLNPAQRHGPTVTMLTAAAPPTAAQCYIWDQTISKSLVGNVAVVRNAVTGGIQFTNTSALDAWYTIQYLTGAQAKKMLGTSLSVNISGFKTQVGGATNCKVYMYSGRAAATIPALPTVIGTVAADGTFTLTAANWTLIPRGNHGTANGTLSTVSTIDYATLNDAEDLAFSGWEITDATQISDTDKFAIVVTYSCPVASTVSVINSISVVPGDIPTRPAPQTPNQVLFECQNYYQMSFPVGTVPAQNAGLAGASLGIQAVSVATAAAGPYIRFPTNLRAVPVAGTTLIIYNPSDANGEIRNITNNTSWSSSTSNTISESGFFTIGVTSGAGGTGNACAIQWTADAALGIL